MNGWRRGAVWREVNCQPKLIVIEWLLVDNLAFVHNPVIAQLIWCLSRNDCLMIESCMHSSAHFVRHESHARVVEKLKRKVSWGLVSRRVRRHSLLWTSDRRWLGTQYLVAKYCHIYANMHASTQRNNGMVCLVRGDKWLYQDWDTFPCLFPPWSMHVLTVSLE